MGPEEIGMGVSVPGSCSCCGLKASDLRSISITQEQFLRRVYDSCAKPASMGPSFAAWCSMCRKIGSDAMHQQDLSNRGKKGKGFKRKREELGTAEVVYEAFREVRCRKIAKRAPISSDFGTAGTCTLCMEVKQNGGASADLQCGVRTKVAQAHPMLAAVPENSEAIPNSDVEHTTGLRVGRISHRAIAELFGTQCVEEVLDLYVQKRKSSGETLAPYSVKKVLMEASPELKVCMVHYKDFRCLRAFQCPFCLRHLARQEYAAIASLCGKQGEEEEMVLVETVLALSPLLQERTHGNSEIARNLDRDSFDDTQEQASFG
eukprot:IDg12556t1